MRKVLSVVLAATMAMSLAACGGSGAKTDTKTDTKAADAGTAAGDEASADDYYITIKFSNVFQPAEWNYKASEYLADLVKEKTDGHITLEYYGQNQLDCYAESVAQAHNGAVWMGLEEPSYFADYNVLVGPMLYKNNAEYNAVMDSDIVKDLNAKLASEHNIHVLDTHYSFGFRSVCTNKVVEKPADLNGLIMRSTESPLFVKTITCLGATPSAMSFTECLSAMSSGVVDGFEGSISTLKDTGAYEYTKKVANTNHFIATRWLFMAEDVEWNDVDIDAFTEACAPVYDWIVDEYGADPELHQKLVDFLNDYRAKNE